MAKTIIKKEVTEYGIDLSFCRRDDLHVETMHFDNEVQLQAFAYFLNLMVSMNAASVEVSETVRDNCD